MPSKPLVQREALSRLQSVTYESAQDFRVRTLMQNYHLSQTDRMFVSSGMQNVSFAFREGAEFSQSVDRVQYMTYAALKLNTCIFINIGHHHRLGIRSRSQDHIRGAAENAYFACAQRGHRESR